MSETIYDFQPDSRNPRVQSKKGSDLLRRSLKELGAARSIVVDADNNVIAGHGTIQAAKEIDLTNVRVINTNGDELVVVRRMDISSKDVEKRMALNLADNASSDMSTYDKLAVERIINDFGAEVVTDWMTPEDNPIFQSSFDMAPVHHEDDDGEEVDIKPPVYKDNGDPTTQHTCPKCGYGFN